MTCPSTRLVWSWKDFESMVCHGDAPGVHLPITPRLRQSVLRVWRLRSIAMLANWRTRSGDEIANWVDSPLLSRPPFAPLSPLPCNRGHSFIQGSSCRPVPARKDSEPHLQHQQHLYLPSLTPSCRRSIISNSPLEAPIPSTGSSALPARQRQHVRTIDLKDLLSN